MFQDIKSHTITPETEVKPNEILSLIIIIIISYSQLWIFICLRIKFQLKEHLRQWLKNSNNAA